MTQTRSRQLALPKRGLALVAFEHTLKLVKIGAKIVSRSRMTIFQMAEVAVPEALFAALQERIRCLATAPT